MLKTFFSVTLVLDYWEIRGEKPITPSPSRSVSYLGFHVLLLTANYCMYGALKKILMSATEQILNIIFGFDTRKLSEA